MFADAAMYWSGAAWLYRSVANCSGAVVLMYHSVPGEEVAAYIDPPNMIAPDKFEKQMKFLRDHRNVISLSELLSMLASGHEPSAGTVCITFDDGYRDNLTVVAPILAKYSLPATIYLPTGYIDRAESHWADVLHQSFKFRSRHRLDIPALGLVADLSDAEQHSKAYWCLHKQLLVGSYDDRTELLKEVEHQLQPVSSNPRLTLNWEEVRTLSESYPLFEIGGHSKNHIDLSAQTDNGALEEVVECRSVLVQNANIVPKHFSYPYARWNQNARHMVEHSGWESAVGNGGSVRIGANSDRYAIARLPTPISMTDLAFKTSGAFPHIYKFFGKYKHES